MRTKEKRFHYAGVNLNVSLLQVTEDLDFRYKNKIRGNNRDSLKANVDRHHRPHMGEQRRPCLRQAVQEYFLQEGSQINGQ